MSSGKILHEEKVIRAGGVLMILSPFANFFMTVASLNLTGAWTPAQLGRLLVSVPLIQLALWVVSFVVGGMMLKGRRESWLPVIVFLGAFIVNNLMHLRADLVAGWFVPILSLSTNVGLFIIVYMQEFRQISQIEARGPAAKVVYTAPVDPPSLAMPPVPRRRRKPQKPAPKEDTVSMVSNPMLSTSDHSGIHVAMTGELPWGHVVSLTETEIVMRCTGDVPARIEIDPVEIVISSGLVMRLQFVSKAGTNYAFRFINANGEDLRRFGAWLRDQTGRELSVRRSS